MAMPSVRRRWPIYCNAPAGRPASLNWYFSYNLLPLCAGITQGIVGRVRDGTANHPQAAGMAERVPLLAKAAWEFAQKAGAT